MTEALAYRASSQSPVRTPRDTSATRDLALVWAVTRLADSMPAPIDDRIALNEARAKLSALADLLGTDEVGLKYALEDRYDPYDEHRLRPSAPP